MLRAAARLPLVAAVEFHRELLAAPEKVVVVDTENQSRAYVTVRLGRDVGLDGGLERHVESRLYRNVERVSLRKRVERGHLDGYRAEYAQPSQIRLGGVLRGYRIDGARSEGDVAGQYPLLQVDRLAVDYRQVGIPDGVGRAAAVGPLQVHVDVPHVVGFERLGRDTLLEGHAQRHFAGREGRIGQILDILGPEVEIAVVAQGAGDAVAFSRERVEAVAVAGLQQRGTADAVDKPGEGGGRRRQLDGVEGVGRRHLDLVRDAGLAGVALVVDEFVVGLGPEVAVVCQNVLDYAHAQLGLHARDEYRLLGQFFVNPVFQPFVAFGFQIVPYPKAQREGGAHVGREEGIVGSHREGGLDFGLHVVGNLHPRVGDNLHLLHAGIEHLVVGEATGGGTPDEYRRGQQGDKEVGKGLFHGAASFRLLRERKSSQRLTSRFFTTKPTPVWVISPSRILS